jgi:tetratricopeptide (TPR) repeat protein
VNYEYVEDVKYWCSKWEEFSNSKDFEMALKFFSESARLYPNNAFVLNYWGNTLFDLAKIQRNKSLLYEAKEKYEEAKKKYEEGGLLELGQNYIIVLCNLGSTLGDLAYIEQNESLFCKAFEKYEEAVRIAIRSNEDDTFVFYNWGFTLANFAKIEHDEKLFKESFNKFYDKSNNLKRLKKDILEILVIFRKTNIFKTFEVKKFYPLLDSDLKINFDFSFERATRDVKDNLELDKYKEVYIRSVSIISQLHIDFKNEDSVAHYTNKTVLQEMLLEDSKFRLNNIDYSNDPNEGKTLLRYLFGEEYPAKKVLNDGYGAFTGSFTFNYDSLNQFRLYGKEEGKEGTGASFVFDDVFFSKEAKIAIEQFSDSSIKEDNKYALFRCMYIDPIRQRIETVGHKETHLFSWENKEKSNKDIDDKIESYRGEINRIIEKVREEMEYLKEFIKVQNLDPTIVGRLLINLRYLTKHVAFKEEQECRILKIHRLNHEKVIIDKSRRIYIEYNPEFSKHIKKIYFGPKATEVELFQDILTNKNIRIICEKSESSLA